MESPFGHVHASPSAHEFFFSTGIENSYPTIATPRNGTKRVDEMEKCDHYNRWREDIALVRDLGLSYLRWGPPYYLAHRSAGQYNWSFSDQVLAEVERLRIELIADLCHFGVPDWIGNFQNPEWPVLFAQYAKEFAKRYPSVRYYTPVNEILIAATFSAKLGWWNERLHSDQAFVTALKHLARANLLAEEAILAERPWALFIQSESTEYSHPTCPQAEELADICNQKRFLSLDLCYGMDVRGCMYEYLADCGLTREEYRWFLQHGKAIKPYCIMGNDYYVTNEHSVSVGGDVQPAGEIFGYYVITKQYHERYHLPVMHTETNLANAEEAPAWLWKEWSNMVRLKQDGVPIVGFTWYSLTDQVDWDSALREDKGHVNELGLFDLDRKIRPVGEAYRKLVAQWQGMLPVESLCLCRSGRHANSFCSEHT